MNIHDRLWLGILLLVLSCAPPPAGSPEKPYERGLSAYMREDYATALQILRPLAENGDARAQFRLGVMYEQGEGVSRNDAKAVKWFRKAADHGNATAQVSLGLMYDQGRGVAEDDGEAAKWFRKAAEQGDAYAQFLLGRVYIRQGRDVRQDYAEAVKWFRKSAEQGFVLAQSFLGKMYADGRGVPQDLVRAYAWFDVAAANGAPPESASRFRDSVAEKLTPEERDEATKLAREFLEKYRAK